MTAALLFFVGVVAGLLLWLGLSVFPRRVAALDAVRAFAEARGALVAGAGTGEPMRVVGVVGTRTFTLLYESSLTHGDVLLMAVDCASAARGPQVRGGVEAEASDEALAMRWTNPPPDVYAHLDRVLAALVDLAQALERESPAEPGEG